MEHTLADEIAPYAIDLARLHALFDSLFAALDQPHPQLAPSNVVIDETAHVTLADEPAPPAYVAPETARTGEVTFSSNVYAIGVMLRALLANRPHVPPPLVELVAACTNPAPGARPSLPDVRATLARALPPPERGVWLRSFVPTDPQERELVAALRANPRDTATRAVYADWLEQHGFEDRAKLLRVEDGEQDADIIEHFARRHAPYDDAGWRAVVSRVRLAGCPRGDCPGRWDALALLALDNVRQCTTCAKAVHFCTSRDAALQHGRRGEPIAVDANTDRTAMRAAHGEGVVGVVRPIPTANPPAPRRDRTADDGDERPGVLTRLFGLFRRR